MRLAFAFLADAAQFTVDGRLWVLGGDLQFIEASDLPVDHPALTLVVKAFIDPDECGQEHIFSVDVEEPSGRIAHLPASEPITPRRSKEHPELPVGIALALNIQQVQFTHFGVFHFRVKLDDQELTSLPLYVMQKKPSNLGPIEAAP